MEIIFAGTGSGKASLKRYHTTTIFFAQNGYNLMIDAGDGASRALLSSQIDFNSINTILFTHFHPDHLNGITSLLIQMKMNKRSNELKLIVHQNLYRAFIKFLEAGYIFKERMGFEIKVLTYGTDSFFKVNEGISFVSKENSHLSKYSANADDRSLLISSSFLLYIDSVRIFYSGDLGENKDLYLFENEKLDVYISEATHVEIPELENAIRKIQPSRIFIDHISDEAVSGLEKWIEALPQELKEMTFLTFDGLKAEIK